MPLQRVLEPEVMDTAEEAHDYDQMDHSEVNQLFVSDLLQFASDNSVNLSKVLDLGTGTALIPVQLCVSHPHCHVTAIDMADHMLQLAAKNVSSQGLSDRIKLEKVDAKVMGYNDGQFDTVMSNSIIHHIPDPASCIGELVRVTMPGGLIFVRDLMRPESEEMVDQFVKMYAGAENEHSKKMFDDSLRAALSLDEIQSLVSQFGFPPHSVSATSDRHWTWAAVRKGFRG